MYSATVIPNRGAWLEYETDSNDVFSVRVDRNRKVPITVFLRALGLGTNEQIREVFGDEPKILASIEKDTTENYQDGLLELYKKLRPGEPLSVDSAENLLNGMFFDPKRYDLAKVGRYKFNKKLHFRYRITGCKLAKDVMLQTTGEILEAGTLITEDLAVQIQNAAVPYVMVEKEEKVTKVLSNMMVDLREYLPDVNPRELGVTENVYYPLLKGILVEEDFFASVNYNMHLEYDIGNDDDIDHLGNRRIRAVGELLQNQYRIGLSRMERVVRERMSTQDITTITAQSLINIKPVTAAVKEFFGSSQLSQFMDQSTRRIRGA